MKIVLIRHAETVANSECRFVGWSESDYSEKGQKQIYKIIDMAKNQKIETIYCSPLKRASNLAKEIAKELNVKLYEKDELKEINFGDFEGKTFAEISIEYKNDIENWINDYKNYTFPKGESFKCFYHRVSHFVEYIKNENKDILIITHRGVIVTIITLLLNLNIDAGWHFKIPPGALVELEYKRNFGTINKILCIK